MENSNNTDKKKKRILIIAIIAALVVLAAIITAGMLSRGGEGEAVEEDAAPVWGDEYLGIDPAVDKSLKDYRNFVIYGVDNNGKSDVINIFSMNKKNGDIKIVAVNRDAYLECDEGKFHKANRGFDWGGIDQGLWEINRNLDLNCREAIALDWGAVERLVDAVGGVEVTIDSSLTLEWVNAGISSYMNISGRDYDANEYLLDSTGSYTLNGIQAVGYCRARKDADSFRRGERNAEVLNQVFTKAKAMSGSELSAVYDEVIEYVDTNMSSNKMTDTLSDVIKGDITDRYIWPVNYETWWDEFYYYVPITLETETAQLHKELFNQKDYQPSDTVKKISGEIEEDLQDGTLHVQ